MSTERIPLDDKALWRSLAIGRPVAPAAVSDMDFAAWLEGQLPEAEAARIDAAVTADPGPAAGRPRTGRHPGQALAGGAAAHGRAGAGAGRLRGRAAGPQGAGWLRCCRISARAWRFQRGALAATAVVVAAVGFMLGGGISKQCRGGDLCLVPIVEQHGDPSARQRHHWRVDRPVLGRDLTDVVCG